MQGQQERVVWYTREWQMANGVCEKTKFAVIMEGSIRIGTRQYSRAVNRAEKNATEAARELARAFNENFRSGTDSYLTLTYSNLALRKLAKKAGIPEDSIDSFLASVLSKGGSGEQEADRLMLYLAAEKEAENYIKRCRRACKAAGVELRYVYVTSDLDEDKKTGELVPARVHHHMIVNQEAAEICARCWKGGWSEPKYKGPQTLYGSHHGDLTDLAEYLIKQVRYIPGKKRYHPSRNLRKPEPGPRRPAKNPDRPLEVPTGCELIFRAESYGGRPQLIRYYRPPEKRRKKRAVKTVERGGFDDGETGGDAR